MKVNLIIAFIIGLCITTVQAELVERIMYKWTDDKGEIHYTERAPKGIEYTVIRTHVESGTIAEKKPKVSDTNASVAKDDNGKSYGSWRKENCTIANQNLDVLMNAKRISVDDGQGGRRLLTDQEKKEKIASMQQQKDKYCSQSAEDSN